MKRQCPESKFRLLATPSEGVTLTLLGDLLPVDAEIREVEADDRFLSTALEWMPDVVLLSLELGSDSGIDLCRRLRETPRLRDLPILIITATEDRAARRVAIDAGADAFIVKPFDLEDMELRLRAILRGKRYRRLLEVERRFEMMAEQAPRPVIVADADHRPLFANKMAVELGIRTDDPRSWIEQVRSRFILKPADDWARLDQGELPEQLLLLDPGPDGGNQPRWLTCSFKSFPTTSDMDYLVSIQDATAVAERQNLLWALKTLVMHKLRTPVNGLLGPIEILMEEDLSPDMREICSVIQHSAERLVETIDNIEAYFRSPTRVGGEPCSVDAFQFLLKSVALQEEVRAPDVVVLAPSDAMLPLNQPSVRLLLTELMENAWKFHPRRDPRISVRILQASEDSITIQFLDDGCHLSAEHLRRMHLPFYQAEDSLTGELRGEGLGLAQVARLIWEHGGSLRFTNRVDKPGLCVCIELPLRKVATAA